MEKKEYRPLTIPRVSWETKALTDTFGELIAQPLEPGFGITIGNALRRVLLGAIEGAAVTSVIITGVNNECSSIAGIVEDTMQLILNIKEIVVHNATGKPGNMRLQIKGESVARVADIQADEHLTLINTDHIIAHVAPGGELDIQFFVETGRGYLPAQWPQGKPYQEDGRIYVDATFSPVRRVMFDVEKTRVGQLIDYDKLILRITTDGSEKPVDVLHYSVSILRTQLEHFLSKPEIPFNEFSTVTVREADITQLAPALGNDQVDLKGLSPELLFKPVEELELSVRAHNCLISAGIKRVIDLVNMSEDDVLKLKNFGKKSLTEVRESMAANGLSFGMNIDEEAARRVFEASKSNA